jgi:coenzyme F420 hydrogenase subunit beta
MKAIESVIHLRREEPKRMKSMIPGHVWDLTAPYGLTPDPDERAPGATSGTTSGAPAGNVSRAPR